MCVSFQNQNTSLNLQSRENRGSKEFIMHQIYDKNDLTFTYETSATFLFALVIKAPVTATSVPVVD